MRIPVGWWIAYDPDPPAPFIGGTLEALDNAFSWAQLVFPTLFLNVLNTFESLYVFNNLHCYHIAEIMT